MGITKREFEAANRRGREMLAKFPAALAVHYDSGLEQLVIALSNGQQLIVAPQTIRGLEKALPEDLVEAEISPSGLGVHFPKIDADVYLPPLLVNMASQSRRA
jgi:hypothetical protein